ncbi:hypothetical protein Btru_042843 [Bulinus truncatus]|nr:hypothetical protein Btru_042843 [Bulinus truncatus]
MHSTMTWGKRKHRIVFKGCLYHLASSVRLDVSYCLSRYSGPSHNKLLCNKVKEMAHFAPAIMYGLLVVSTLLAVGLGQVNDGSEFLCTVEGLYTNPSDCGGFYQCANGIDRPFVRKCAPGSHFDEDQRTCSAIPDVQCNGRPVTDTLLPSGNQPSSPPSRSQSNVRINTYQANLSVANPSNTVTLRLNSRQNGPLLRSEQCAEIGRQMSRYLRSLVSTYEPTCTATSVCQQNLPFFKVECQTATGRVIV